MLTNDAVIEVMGVEQLSDYKLKLRLSDGTERVIDFEPFLKTSRNQLISAYLEPEQFADFRIEYGDLVWGDYGLCFPIADLHEGHLSHPGSDR